MTLGNQRAPVAPAQKRPTFDALAATIPAELRERQRWCGWTGVPSPDDRSGKAPRNLANGGSFASSADPTSWVTFDKARAWYDQHPQGGVGFVTGDNIGAYDLDATPDAPPAPELVKRLQGHTYTESSPSGVGVRAFVVGANGMVQVKGTLLSYHDHQFVTVTGRNANQRPLSIRLPEHAALFENEKAANEPTDPNRIRVPEDNGELADDLARLYSIRPVLVKHFEDKGCDYNGWKDLAAALQGTFGGTVFESAAEEFWADLTAELPGYNRGDERKLDDFRRKDGVKLTVASIFALADEADPGWREKHRQRMEVRVERAEPLLIDFDTLDDILDRTEPIRKTFLVNPYFPDREVLYLYGPGGSFKSYITLDLTLAIACGRRWGGHEVRKGRSIFVSLEDDRDTIGMRIRAYLAGSPFKAEGREEEEAHVREMLRERFKFISRAKTRGLHLTELTRTGTVTRQRAVDAWCRLAEGRDFLVMETVSRLHRAPENDNGAAAVYLEAVERIRDRAGPTILYVHHMSREGARSATPQVLGGRGATAFEDNARGAFEVRRESEEKLSPVRLIHKKPPPYAGRGDDIVWKPDVNEEALYLTAMSENETMAEDGRRLLAHIAQYPEGIAERALRTDAPKGLSVNKARGRGREVLQWLVEKGQVSREPRGTGHVYKAVKPAVV